MLQVTTARLVTKLVDNYFKYRLITIILVNCFSPNSNFLYLIIACLFLDFLASLTVLVILRFSESKTFPCRENDSRDRDDS